MHAANVFLEHTQLEAVKSKLSEDIVKIINEKTAPLKTTIDNLEKENRKLKNEVDALEQYGRYHNFINQV
jgi:cell division protein FtsB